MTGYLKLQWLPEVYHFICRNRLLLSLIFSLFTGILVGGILSRSLRFSESLDLSSLVQNHFQERAQSGLVLISLRSFGSAVIYLFSAYLCGLSAWGCIPLYCIPACKGLGIGAVCGYLYFSQGLYGLAFVLLMVIPVAFLNSLLLVVACGYALPFSIKMLSCCLSFPFQQGHAASLRIYHIRFGMFVFIEAIVALLDGLLASTFIHIFPFT